MLYLQANTGMSKQQEAHTKCNELFQEMYSLLATINSVGEKNLSKDQCVEQILQFCNYLKENGFFDHTGPDDFDIET
jgi:hypothetical protein